jgi:DNA-binding Lrp family transcriptional regulator
MARPSTIDHHPQRAEIEAALLAGTSFRIIAERYGISTTALHRHKERLSVAIVKAQTQAEESRADALRRKIERLECKAESLGNRAETDGDLKTALAAVRELARLLELGLKVADVLEIEERLAALESNTTSGNPAEIEQIGGTKYAD